MVQAPSPREIPFNYTSADDRQAVSELLGPAVWAALEELRTRRVTGRSARLLFRFFGEMMVHRRNPFLYEELVRSSQRRRRFLSHIRTDLGLVERNSRGEPLVLSVLEECRRLLATFQREVQAAPALRRRILHELAPIVGADGVRFDPFTLVSHATDATDWRLFLPLVVVFPAREEQVAPLLAALGRLRLPVIPRGGGTGLTGGAVPLRAGCAVLNTERLDRIRGMTVRRFRATGAGEGGVDAPVLEVEAGVVTEKAMEWAADHGLVFATDPTSAWASTIGGNIAENAGGKGCVQWGTCIDNLLSWRMALPGGRRITVRRVDHPLRKILPGDAVEFTVHEDGAEAGGDGAPLRTVRLAGDEIRRPGLWKDITNKALGGLPGMQKEGTDGIVTSAEFVLHPAFPTRRTLCLEFFGPDFDEASEVILALSRAFPFGEGEQGTLTALEHFDDAYVRAIDYRVKAARKETPRAVLLVDLSGQDEAQVERGAARLRQVLSAHPNTALHVARGEAEARRFWADRKRLGAIARRTNAFKMNEDVVLPLESLAAFARWIDEANAEEERFAQLRFLERAEAVLQAGSSAEADEAKWIATRLPAALERCARAREELAAAAAPALRDLGVLTALRADLAGLLRGAPALVEALDRVHAEVRDRLVVLATHMHAGDGNVHVNVPVLSNDLPMLRRVEQVIDRVMEEVVRLGGVVSGEHGIGVTKLKYLAPERIEALTAYRRTVDPDGLMNPGKLQDRDVLDRVFTPSFNLLELEARILQHGQLVDLARAIAHCVRCGKCKGGCCVHHPARGLFFHPRNKNLAIGALIEALLYDAQRERTTRFDLLRKLEEVADHCTICHKCLAPCPVAIDTGAVSVLERQILADFGFKRTPAATRATLRYLDSRSPTANKLYRAGLVRLGGAAQRAAAAVLGPLQPSDPRRAPYPLQLLRAPLPPAPRRTLRDALPRCAPDQALLLEPPGEARRSVFYFPGCGSERLRGEVGQAALHLLLRTGHRVVVPPPFLCCGFPAHANAKADVHARTVLRDTILFSQIRDMFGYLTFDGCAVSCGTCREALLAMGAGELFGGRVVDAVKLALEAGLRVEGDEAALYHAPCHDSLEGQGLAIIGAAGGASSVEPVEHCCSEAGTLALSRPDIADAMLDRKRGALQEALHGRPSATVLTNCPSCLQGLGRLAGAGARPKHLAVHLAERLDGEAWGERLAELAAGAQAIHF
jgi:FAD/FMN-containing dehydrogenase/Fe-S oxidoreductase